MKTAFIQTVAAEDEPITTDQARPHLRLGRASDLTSEEESDLRRMIAGVRAEAEAYMGRGLLTQTWKLTASDWADEFALPMAAPLQSVTSVKYYNTAGVLTTLASTYYLVDTTSTPGRLYRAPQQVWPQLQADRAMPVEITYVVGWADPDDILPDIKDGLFLRLGDRWEHRENTVVGTITSELASGAKDLWRRHRVRWTEPTCA